MSNVYVSEFGVKWDERVPRGSIRWLINRLHVSVTDDEIERDIRSRCTKGYAPALINQSVKYALECHRRNRGLYRDVVNGNI